MKKAMSMKLVTMALVAGAFSASALAASDGGNARFAKLDSNRDGSLSRDEVRHIAGYARAFAQADDNRDGRLNMDEFVKAEAIHDRSQAAGFVEDSVITAKVKGSLLKELKSLTISVETYQGRVLLSGFVDNEIQVKKALQVASSIEGVKKVRNGLALK